MKYEKTTVDALPDDRRKCGYGLVNEIRALAVGEAIWVPNAKGKSLRKHQSNVSASSRNANGGGKKFITRVDQENNRVAVGRIA